MKTFAALIRRYVLATAAIVLLVVRVCCWGRWPIC